MCHALLLLICLPTPDPEDFSKQVQTFLEDYNRKFAELVYTSSLAEWEANTVIMEGDDSRQKRVETANEALAAFTGSTEVIEKTRAFLQRRNELSPLQLRQLEAILYNAGNNPQTVPELVKRRIAAEAEQTAKLFGFDYQLKGKSVSTNDLDDLLVQSRDLDERLAAWTASKEVGPGLRAGLVELVALRNKTVQALGYKDFFEYQVSEYGLSSQEMMAMMERFLVELRPLYRELHTWARHELAKRYGVPVPQQLPAHWLPNRWGQDWSALVTVEGFDLDGSLKAKSAEWIVRQGEDFYVSLGFPNLPTTFYEKSSLYPLPADAKHKKNNHASAWHLDLKNDIRSLMSVQNNARWYGTVHHELGHIYYYMCYSSPQIPIVLREGANRGFHEGVGSLMGLASSQKAFLQGRGLLASDAKSDEIQALLKEALEFVVFIPFSAGVMTHFERDLYEGRISAENYNSAWWNHALRFQGMVPPSPRGENYCDAATKTHINDDAAQYYDYAISFILLHQLHAHIAQKILKQDPRNTNYYGSKETGAFLRSILEKGASQDWRAVMHATLGEEINAGAILAYFAPLMEYLREQNKDRQATLADL